MTISIDLGGYNGMLSFNDIDEIKTWLQNEKNNWSWFQEISRKDQALRNYFTNNSRGWNEISERINRISKASDNETEDIIKSIVRIIERMYKSERMLLSSSQLAQYVIDLSKNEPLEAAYALEYLMGGRPNDLFHERVSGSYAAIKFLSGEISNIDSERKSLSELRRRFQSDFDNKKNKIEELKTDFLKVINDGKNLQAKYLDIFNDFIGSSKMKLEEIEKIYNEKLALQSSVSYWDDKYKHHCGLSKGFGIASGILILLLCVGLGLVAYEILATEAAQPPYWKMVILVFIAVTGVWLARIVVRIFFSHLHLETDARERLTMLKTYLALLREGKGLKDDERQLILQALFRPVTSGIVKDDGIPPSAWDLLSRFKS